MAEFLTTQETVAKIEDIIRNAQSTLVLISPYWQLSKNWFVRISDAAKRNTPVTILIGKDSKPECVGNLLLLKNIKIKHLENLHAKCYFNQDCMVISSMNMYEFSEKNREMGIYIRRDTDKQLFEVAKKEAEHFLQHAIPLSSLQSEDSINFNTKIPSIRMYAKKDGVCIRCSNNLKYNPEKPLCTNCYNAWSKWNDELYPEKYCHSCGKKADTSMAYPECYSCYKANSKMIAG
ncbi:MAG: phospholipase D-like domain-containing protein [Chitinophagaceae bacterium]|nr:phospholipase D-like domain-containing protein [Chitinophagaceae bacterium]